MIRELKRRIGEYQEYHDFTEEEIWAFRHNSWQIIPVNFQKRHREMSQCCNVAMDLYADVKKIHQDTSFAAEVDSFIKDSSRIG